jgi:hypothetical protein
MLSGASAEKYANTKSFLFVWGHESFLPRLGGEGDYLLKFSYTGKPRKTGKRVGDRLRKRQGRPLKRGDAYEWEQAASEEQKAAGLRFLG